MESQEFLTKYFSGNSSEEERVEVEKWAESSEENMAEFHHFKQAWGITNPDRFDVSKAFESIVDRLEEKTPEISMPAKEKPNFLKIAASFLILIAATALVYGYFTGFGSSASSGVIAKSEENVTLVDGSKLYLAMSGKLTYQSDFNKDVQRKVKLEGKAFFDIQEDKSKPFIIQTNNAEIEVTGTSFMIDEKSGYTEVIVASGSVKLKKADGVSYIRLSKGETGVVSKDVKGLVKRNNRNKNYLSWMTGSFEFQSTPMFEVIDLLEQKYHVKIKLEDKTIGNCKYNATFDNRSIDDIVEIIGKSLGLKVTKGDNVYTFDGPGC
ncbi:MAG: FecR domain-containing protein [Bacteroidota bacterium]